MPLLRPPPPPFSTRTREPSPIAHPTAGDALKQPKCPVEYKRCRHLQSGSAGHNLNAEDFSTVNAAGEQRPRHPGALDKLSAYRRIRSLTPHESGGGIHVPPTNPADRSPNRSRMIDVGVEKKTEPVITPQIPKEVTEYILGMEEQNRFLRQNIVKLQNEFRQQQVNLSKSKELADVVVGNTHRVISGCDSGENHANGINELLVASEAFTNHEDRERYVNDVLAQVDVIVQAHHNKSQAELLRYKGEAEAAKLALRQIREAIALEGVDLSMLPAAIATLSGRPLDVERSINTGDSNKNGIKNHDGRKERQKQEGEGMVAKDAVLPPRGSTTEMMGCALSGIMEIMVEKCKPFLCNASDAVLADLLRVEADDDVPAVVRDSVRRAVETLAQHLTSFVADYVGHYIHEVRYLQQERGTARREMWEELSASEHQRLRMAQRYEAEICALRDELHAFHVAAADGDELRATVHDRALAEYTKLLAESRVEATTLRSKLEEAHNDHATMCLRLKASLERRGAEFEAVVTRRSAEILQQRDDRIGELERVILQQQEVEDRRRRGRAVKGVQVQIEEVERDKFLLDEAHFVPNLLAVCSNGKKEKSASGLNRSFATSPFSARHHVARGSETPRGMGTGSGVGLSSAKPSLVYSIQSGSESALQREDSFEEEVWSKTMELLTKYGNMTKH